ncbi:hypothetical protein KWG76_11090 [Haloterrigena longa]|uniref:Uncharacterized protein n=2 Tax=Natrinema longum TaxID=370324 RepID=A0A8A2UHF9_9EURY|nr:hypothetical protein [Natrinema longum]MBZ6495460.1 hypothetical protein [Natrinema longum]QSW86965.1 hypothetical protein J0X27_07070 [Natrinema longum]
MLSRPSGEYGRLGFYLINPDKINDSKDLINPTTAPEWKDHPLNFELPSEGLPTDSSPSRISEYRKNQRKLDQREKKIEHEKTDPTSTSGDSGVITEYSHESTLEGRCENTNYQVNFGILADTRKDHKYNEIGENQSNVWRFYVYFGNRPNDIFDCDSVNHIQPSNYSLHVEPFYDEQEGYINFSHPEPADGDGENDNDELGLALDIVRSTGKLASIGASIADYVMDGSGSSTTVEYHDGGTIYDFDVDLSGSYNDLPRELSDKGKTTQFSLRVHNEWPADDMMCSIEFQPEYTFHYADSTPCTCFDATPVGMYKTVTPDWAQSPEAWYDSVDT